MANNITKVYLLNVPLENDYKNTLYFEGPTAQQQYFAGRVVHSYTDFSYQRKDNIIRIPAIVDDLYNCNYVMYQNTAQSNKWFYAFITDLKYVNDERTDVTIETDCMQTWLFDYTVKPSFVEREHVDDDTIGLHTIPEQLETGEYICNDKNKYIGLTANKRYVVGSTLDLFDKDSNNADETKPFPPASGDIYNGVYSGVRYYAYNSASEAEAPIIYTAWKGQADGINSIFMVPGDFVTIENNRIPASVTPTEKTWSLTKSSTGVIQRGIYKPDNINGHTPKNNKLFTYPYTYLLMSNNAGGSAVYHYEYFNDDAPRLCDFKIKFALTPGCSIRLIPLKYKSVDEHNDEGLNCGKFPVCSWSTDVYTNWLTQNAINIPNQIGSALVSTVTGATAGAVGGSVIPGVGNVVGGIAGGIAGATSGISSIVGTVSEIYQHSLQSPQASGNLNSGDVTYSNNDLTFTAYSMSIKREFAEIIDSFFTMFGYKVNRVKVPNENHRSRFWYTKTVDINIDVDINNRDMQIIKNCYNNGITFWRSASDINNYTTDNIIIKKG